MSKGSSLRLGFSRFTRRPLTLSRRYLHPSPPCTSAVTLPLHDVLIPSGLDTSIFRSDPRELLKKKLFAELNVSLKGWKRSPTRVWGQYLDLLHFVGSQGIPLEIHQSVLRQCVPPAARLRVSVAHHLKAGGDPKKPHQYEIRLQTVIRNIKAAGWQPTLDDYHFILEQFAAVGHHLGAAQVYRELGVIDLHPTPKTFGLLLQALAHRLTLPCPEWRRSKYVVETTATCRDILAEMWDLKIPFSSVNLDLAIRILKETADEEGFKHLMRIGYGIDLDYPDRAPVEQLERGDNVTASADELGQILPSPQPFSTAALNTTIDMLGRMGNIPKLIQAFEVLTQLLPSQAGQHFSRSFDDEDDDYGVSHAAPTQLYKTPHAPPNTTTYNILLRHISRAGHGPLARHYLQQAFCFDRQADRANRSQMIELQKKVVEAPHFAVNKGTILPVFGLANRDKDMELMRWVGWVIRQTLRRKRNDVIYYSTITGRLSEELSQLPPEIRASSETVISPSSSPTQTPSNPTSSNPAAAVFEVDLDAPCVPSPPAKRFDIHFHLQLLKRDIEQLGHFNKEVSIVISRTVQRIKERLGRRVWAGKNIYLLSNRDRKVVSRQAWSNIVRFKHADGLEARRTQIRFQMRGREEAPHQSPNFTAKRLRISSTSDDTDRRRRLE